MSKTEQRNTLPASPALQAAYLSAPQTHQAHLLHLRQIILEVGSALQDTTGPLEETLKWGQPSYLPSRPRIGTTVRVAPFDDHHVGLYFHCQSLLVERFRATYGDVLSYSKNRALLFNTGDALPEDEIRHCVEMALVYHLDKRQGLGG